MLLLTCDKLSYSLPGRQLLEEASLSLEKGEKVGLIGRNGSGKSTLLRLLSGALQPDSGEVTLRGETTVRILDQLPSLEGEEDRPLRAVVGRGCTELFGLRQEYDEVCRAMETASAAQQQSLEKRLNRLTDQLTLKDGWDLETRAATLLTTLGFPDPDRPLRGMSGGELKRVAMARTLLVPPDILLLDEPTNHLDIATIAWLESFLKSASFTVLMVTHDRYFLERVCTRIIEISAGTTHGFSGSYSSYLEQKAEREATAARQQERFDNVLRQEQAWLRQGAKARSTKQKARLQRAQAMIASGSGIVVPDGLTEDAAWDLGTRRLGRKVVRFHSVAARVLEPLDFLLEPGERVGLVGANGSGKTTFLDLLAGRLEPESGRVEMGETVHIGYFDQHTDRLRHLPSNTRVLDAVKDVATSIPLSNGKEVSAARLCEMFLFTGRSQATPLEKLSGGERKRLELLRLLIDRPNLVLLDEPTNDLDIETLQRLEYFLDSFPGCVCIASHDRYLLQRLCDRIMIFRQGHVEEELPEVLDAIGPGFFELKPSAGSPAVAAPPSGSVAAEMKKRKLTYKEQEELKTLERSIPKLETRLTELETELAAQSSNYTALKELYAKKEATEKSLQGSMERWAELEELRESLLG
jgi:ATP-binding cassette subfamily F protein uup